MTEKHTVVIDSGSLWVKANLGHRDFPHVFPNLAGKVKPLFKISNTKDFFVADEAHSRRSILDLVYPVERGIITNWDAMEKIWTFLYREDLRVNSDEHPVLLTETPLNPKANRERMTETMFEKFSVPALYIGIQAVLSLLSSGRTTGLVVDSGAGVTHAVSVYEGCAIRNAVIRMEMGGNDLDLYLIKLLQTKGYSFTTRAEREAAREIKEKHCYVAKDLDHEKLLESAGNLVEKSYELPDGNFIQVGSEQFMCPEALFQPSLLGLEDQVGVQGMAYNSITKCDVEVRRELCRNVVLAGANTMYEGMAERLQKELSSLAPDTVKVIAPLERKYSAWVGGCILGSMSTFNDVWISKKEYEEFGPGIVHERCT